MFHVSSLCKGLHFDLEKTCLWINQFHTHVLCLSLCIFSNRRNTMCFTNSVTIFKILAHRWYLLYNLQIYQCLPLGKTHSFLFLEKADGGKPKGPFPRAEVIPLQFAFARSEGARLRLESVLSCGPAWLWLRCVSCFGLPVDGALSFLSRLSLCCCFGWRCL